jgi:hypothetical protein
MIEEIIPVGNGGKDPADLADAGFIRGIGCGFHWKGY